MWGYWTVNLSISLYLTVIDQQCPLFGTIQFSDYIASADTSIFVDNFCHILLSSCSFIRFGRRDRSPLITMRSDLIGLPLNSLLICEKHDPVAMFARVSLCCLRICSGRRHRASRIWIKSGFFIALFMQTYLIFLQDI